MAAPKTWGYTRDQAIANELLISWADGDLTADVAKEVDERFLASREDRELLADFARATEDTHLDEEVRWIGKLPGSRKIHLLWPRSGLVDVATRLAIADGDWSGPGEPEVAGEDQAETWYGIPMARFRAGTIFPGILILAVCALIIYWMINNL